VLHTSRAGALFDSGSVWELTANVVRKATDEQPLVTPGIEFI